MPETEMVILIICSLRCSMSTRFRAVEAGGRFRVGSDGLLGQLRNLHDKGGDHLSVALRYRAGLDFPFGLFKFLSFCLP